MGSYISRVSIKDVYFSFPQVFYKGHAQPVFYVASRGHHADIGGITPGV